MVPFQGRFNLFLDPNTTAIEHVLTSYSRIQSSSLPSSSLPSSSLPSSSLPSSSLPSSSLSLSSLSSSSFIVVFFYRRLLLLPLVEHKKLSTSGWPMLPRIHNPIIKIHRLENLQAPLLLEVLVHKLLFRFCPTPWWSHGTK